MDGCVCVCMCVRGGGLQQKPRFAEAENTHTNLRHLLCDSVEIPPTHSLARTHADAAPPAQTHARAHTPRTTHPSTHAGVAAVLTLPSRQQSSKA